MSEKRPLPPSRTADQYIVRFPEGMRDRIAEEAKKNSRSMNAEIIARLGDSFKREEVTRMNREQMLELLDQLIQAKLPDYMAMADAAREKAKKGES